MLKRLAGLLGVALLAAACAESTPYQPVGESRYGYDEQRIETDRYLVTFTGNSLTERDTVETFLLYRAAELTLEEGYDYFTVVRRDTDEETRYSSANYDRFHVRYRYFHPYYGWYGWRDPFWDDTSRREINRYEAIAEIARRDLEAAEQLLDALLEEVEETQRSIHEIEDVFSAPSDYLDEDLEERSEKMMHAQLYEVDRDRFSTVGQWVRRGAIIRV